MRLLVNGEWFEAVSSWGQFERDFERLLFNQAGAIFPEHYTVPFKVPVETEHDRKIPDLALIDRSYRQWWVVEVEMGHHSLAGHVLPQVEVFARGKYGNEHGRYLLEQSNELDPDSVRDMIKGSQPGVLVVVNQEVPSWIEPIHHVGGLLTIVQIFRSSRNQHILRVNGDLITETSAELVSVCRLDPFMPRLLQVDSPASLGVAAGERLKILFGEGTTEWARIDSADRVWLNPIGNNPLSSGREYQVMKELGGRYYFADHEP